MTTLLGIENKLFDAEILIESIYTVATLASMRVRVESIFGFFFTFICDENSALSGYESFVTV